MPVRRQHAERNGDKHRNQDREQGERQGRLDAFADQRSDGLLEEEALAEIAPQHLAGPDEELLDHRAVEAKLAADLRHLFGGGIVAGDDRCRIRRGQAQHQEDEDRDQQHPGDRAEQSPEQVAIHGSIPETKRAARSRPLPSHHFATSMFHCTGTGAIKSPLTFLRMAIGWTYSPTGIMAVISILRFWTASAISFCFARSDVRAKSSRSFSMSASHGHPNEAFSHPEFT